MEQTKLKFIESLILPKTGGYLEARVVKANEDDAIWWQKHVQSVISQDKVRPDRGWDWLKIVNGTHPAVRFARFLGQRPQIYCVVVQDGEGRAIPIGMVFLVEEYVFLQDHSRKAPFIWYLAGAPGDVLRKYLSGQRPGLLQTMVDIGVVVSVDKGHGGRLGLHADPQGGAVLVSKYETCGLKVLPKESKLPRGRGWMPSLGAVSDIGGSYLYADIDTAKMILEKSNHLRQHPPASSK